MSRETWSVSSAVCSSALAPLGSLLVVSLFLSCSWPPFLDWPGSYPDISPNLLAALPGPFSSPTLGSGQDKLSECLWKE